MDNKGNYKYLKVFSLVQFDFPYAVEFDLYKYRSFIYSYDKIEDFIMCKIVTLHIYRSRDFKKNSFYARAAIHRKINTDLLIWFSEKLIQYLKLLRIFSHT